MNSSGDPILREAIAAIRHSLGAELDATTVERVVVVGAFGPFLRSLKRGGIDYLVLEQDPATLKADELSDAFMRRGAAFWGACGSRDPTNFSMSSPREFRLSLLWKIGGARGREASVG